MDNGAQQACAVRVKSRRPEFFNRAAQDVAAMAAAQEKDFETDSSELSARPSKRARRVRRCIP